MRLITVCLLLWMAADFPVVEPKEVAAALAKGPGPSILYVGPNVLYRSKHIRGALFAGPGSRPEGLELLKTEAAKLPRDRDLVLYCGCCPWDHCPNVKPADEALHGMGFTNVKVLYVSNNFGTNWVDQGYPVAKGE
jgi:rhodanese-related sulfurtransferase